MAKSDIEKILLPTTNTITVCGQEIDITRIPAGASIEIISMIYKGAEDVDTYAKIVAAVTKKYNMPYEYLVENATLSEIVDAAMEIIAHLSDEFSKNPRMAQLVHLAKK